MFREVFQSTPAEVYSSIALVIFLATFAAISFWVLTRRQKIVNRWADLALHDQERTGPSEPRNGQDRA